MINYSIVMLGNPAKQDEPKKAYGVAQYSEKVTIDSFCEHISDHNNVYDAEDVQAILGKAVKCLREMLLAGKKVELGKLGEFSVTLQGKGTVNAKDYNPANCVEKVNVIWTPGERFKNLKNEATYNFVASRNEQTEAKRKAKAQSGIADEDTPTDTDKDTDTGKDTDTDTSQGGSSQSGGGTGTDTDSEF